MNGGRWIAECLSSALRQTYERIEILVVDDGSTDNTVDFVRSLKDDRIRVVSNATRRGLAGNWNECIRLAQGDFIKFLFQDDALYPDCVDRMVSLLLRHPQLGMVFARRDLMVERDTPSDLAANILLNFGDPHLKFGNLHEVNNGRQLFGAHYEQGFYESCIAEPPTTLVRKEVFRQLGLFNTRMCQACDIEMWLRIMFFYDVGFLDEKLLFFRVHGDSASAANHLSGSTEYDHFWLLEGLLSHPEITREYPRLSALREEQLRRYQDSLLRPKDGWLSIRRNGGLRQALRDARTVPDRVKFLRETRTYGKNGPPLHPRLQLN
jgi:glycosyltransferase involved in cell wall biosynthesis